MSNESSDAEAADIAAFVKKHLQSVVDTVIPEFLGVNVSKGHAAYGSFVEASALLIVGKLISESIREVGRETVKSLDEIESAVMTAV
ncbi:hypothetical+protein [Methylocapsa aurea]|uniref:hypothetical protein n=1 Tax=Methylocapsa aurea TaxID=663610 RepID=UPI003D18F988